MNAHQLRGWTFVFSLLTAAFTATSHAGVLISGTLEPTPNLPGYQTFTLTAHSDNPAQPILGFDFAGHPDNNDPATGRGFFGPMSQVNPVGSMTVFQDNNVFFPLVGRNVKEDSQFLVSTFTPGVVAPSGFGQEGPNILQGVWAYADSQGLSVPFAQIVTNAFVSFRGTVLVGQSGFGIEVPVQGQVSVSLPSDIDDLTLVNEVLNGTVNGTVTGTNVLAWSDLTFLDYTPAFGAPGDAPGLNLLPDWDPNTQLFSWNTTGSNRGIYRWEVHEEHPHGGGPSGIILVEQRAVPEPASAVLLAIVCVGASGFISRRP